MKVIYKYPLNVPFCGIDLPKGGKVVCVHEQHGVPTLWVEQETGSELIYYKFLVVGTGQTIPEDGVHIGTCFIGHNVWHVYQKIDP